MKVAIIGYAGAGKSTLARGCPEIFDLELALRILFEGRNRRRNKDYMNTAERYPDKFHELKNSKEVSLFHK